MGLRVSHTSFIDKYNPISYDWLIGMSIVCKQKKGGYQHVSRRKAIR